MKSCWKTLICKCWVSYSYLANWGALFDGLHRGWLLLSFGHLRYANWPVHMLKISLSKVLNAARSSTHPVIVQVSEVIALASLMLFFHKNALPG